MQGHQIRQIAHISDLLAARAQTPQKKAFAEAYMAYSMREMVANQLRASNFILQACANAIIKQWPHIQLLVSFVSELVNTNGILASDVEIMIGAFSLFDTTCEWNPPGLLLPEAA